MSKKWWIESSWRDDITEVECVKETEKQVVILVPTWADKNKLNERRMNKEGAIFDSFLDAKNHLIERSKNEISRIQSTLDSAKARLKKRNDIPHPKQ